MDRVIKKKKWTLQNILLYFVAPILILVLIFLAVRATGTSRLRIDRSRVTISEVTYGPFQEFTAINGEVLPIETRIITALVGGQVEEVFMEGGEILSEGDVILKLTNPDQEFSYMQQETALLEQADQLRNTRIRLDDRVLDRKEQLQRIESDLILQKINHERNQELYDDSVISEAEFLETQNVYEYSLQQKALIKRRIQQDSQLRELQINQLDNSLDMVQRNLSALRDFKENFTIRAPIRGQLSSIRVQIGENVASGQEIGQIDVLDGYKVRAQIDEYYIDRIQAGLKGIFTFSGQQYELVIRKVYPEVLANGVFEVDMDFVKTPEGIKRGQNLQIRLALSEEEQALMIPRGGFYSETAGNWIFVVDERQGVANRRDISIDRQSDRFYKIESGLEEGEKVITSSYENYKDIDMLVLE